MPVNDLALLEQIVVLAGHLAWPVTSVILLLLTRRLIAQIASAIADRIKNPDSSFSLGPDGIKVDSVKAGLTDTGTKLNDRLNSNPEFRQQLIEWLKKKNLNLEVTHLVFLPEYEGLRKMIVSEYRL